MPLKSLFIGSRLDTLNLMNGNTRRYIRDETMPNNEQTNSTSFPVKNKNLFPGD